MNPSKLEGTFERKFAVNGRVSLDVSVHAGVIRILGGEPGCVTVRGVLRARSSSMFGVFLGGTPTERIRRFEMDPPVVQDGNSIRVGDVSDRWMLRGINFLVEISTPLNTEVRALADSGDIRVEGLDGPVECEADSGDINISNIGSEVRAAADSGSIHIRAITGAVDARADSGHIEALEVAGPIDAKTDSGDIRLSQTKVAAVCAQADSGRIFVQLAPQGGYSVRVRTDNGRMDLPALTGQRISRHELDGDIRGGGSVVDLETDSGDIEIVAD
jgi:Putative adhesin